MGKLVATFTLFLAASALAVHEAHPPPRPVDAVAPPRALDDATPPARGLDDPVPPWVRYAAPPAPPPPPPPLAPPPIAPPTIVIDGPPPATIIVDGPDLVDPSDRCPTEPQDDVDSDGYPDPEPAQRLVIRLEALE